jgi:predicted metal-binding membrane protein
VPEISGRNAVVGVSALLFATSTAVTVAWCLSMSGMGEVAMPGGWTLSMAWLPVCGQTWTGAAASFVGMWAVMMVAMMLPSLVPVLLRYGRALAAFGESRAGSLTALAGSGYFLVWTVLGAIIFGLGAAVAEATLQMPALARSVPAFQSLVLLLAGAFQFTSHKAKHLACCRTAPSLDSALPTSAWHAWRCGMSWGLQCCGACAGLTASLLAIGVMDLRAMVLIGTAISVERLAPAGQRAARAIGLMFIVAGLCLLWRAAAIA